MSLATHHANLAFTSDYPIDKIVGIYTGTFNQNTDVKTYVYTFSTAPYNVYYYVIPHNFKRPVYCELLSSHDGVSYNNTSLIALSDANNIYIYAAQSSLPPSQTIWYKVVCSWIDLYDGTNPSVAAFAPTTGFWFDSRANYQKIFKQGVITLSNSVLSATVTHNLGYQPNVKVFMETFPGWISPLHNGEAFDLFNYADNQVQGNAYTNGNTLTFNYSGGVSSPAGRFFYRIYMDN